MAQPSPETPSRANLAPFISAALVISRSIVLTVLFAGGAEVTEAEATIRSQSLRCMVPALTEDRRKELIKKAKAQGETTKVTIRNARRDGIDLLKKAQKNDGLSEDGEKEGEEELQKLTDKWVKKVDEIIAAKEKDILTV